MDVPSMVPPNGRGRRGDQGVRAGTVHAPRFCGGVRRGSRVAQGIYRASGPDRSKRVLECVLEQRFVVSVIAGS